MKALLSVSDQAAISVIDKLDSKGGPRYLTWNLPERAFKEVTSEAIELTDAENVDVDPNGGNMRMLDEVIRLGWNMKTWLNEQVIAAICDAFKKY